MFSAIFLRSPRKGIRRSGPAGTLRGARATASAARRPLVGAGAFLAAWTSSEVMRPAGPLPAMVVRSTPRSRASLRVAGVASGTALMAAATGAAEVGRLAAGRGAAEDGGWERVGGGTTAGGSAAGA